ncbi:glycosyl hydrolase [Raoultella planticola]|uniref:glycosyl hydrolase n=1 Tax=Raoultella planticola TaxID=575 RepID=UPI0034E42457
MSILTKKILLFLLLSIISFYSSATDNGKIVGVCFHPEKTGLNNEQLFLLMGKYNFGSFRTDYRWSSVESIRDEYKTPSAQLDELIIESNAHKITPLIILGYKNSLYGPGKPIDAAYQQAFVNYAVWVAEKYKTENVIFEIYNEWWHDDLHGLMSTSDSKSAKSYFELIKMTSEAIKRVDPNSKIIAGSLNPLDERHVYWFVDMMKLGIMNYIDGISIHPYSTNKPEVDFVKIDRFENLLSSKYNKGNNVNIYITEMGYSDSAKGKLSSEEQQSYARSYMELVNSRDYIKGIWWYELVNEKNGNNSYESNFGLLNSNLSEKVIMKGFLN